MKGDSFVFNHRDIELEALNDIPKSTIRSLTLKCYMATQEISPFGPKTESVHEFLSDTLTEIKPYILENDLVLPFTCPSLVVDLNAKKEAKMFRVTPYGDLPIIERAPRIEEGVTEINVDFFDYPLYNAKTSGSFGYKRDRCISFSFIRSK